MAARHPEAGPLARLERDGAVATIILDRPEALNAIDIAMAETLAGLADIVAADPEIRVLVLRGAGSGFCAGGDIQLFAEAIDDIGAAIGALLGAHHRFLLTLRNMPKLVLTSVHGAVAGAGFSLAFMGDLCIAADTARLRPAYARLGVSPDGGGTVGLVDAVGPRRALAIFLGSDELPLEEAKASGLVSRIVPADRLEAETQALARRLAETPVEAIAATKALVYRRGGGDVAGQLEAERDLLIGCMKSEAFRERVRAFLDKNG
jgi:enoyl-CoA hydratase/carnithine racemase